MLKIEAQEDLFPGIELWGFLSIHSVITFCHVELEVFLLGLIGCYGQLVLM